MKRLLSVLLVGLIVLSSCSNSSSSSNTDESTIVNYYYDMLELLTSATSFLDEPIYFDITVDIAKIDDGYRYYVIVDNAKIALYNVQVLAIVVGEDYSDTMAPSAGIFEGTYNMIPNQANVDAGYVAGLSVSGLCEEGEITIDILVRYTSSDMETIVREYYRYTATYQEEND